MYKLPCYAHFIHQHRKGECEVNIFDKIFHKQPKHDVPAMPAWETVVKMMYDQHLDGYSAEVIQVIYSKDKSKRYVILKDERGFFTHQLEAIYQYDPAEWQYIGSNKNALPAMWEPVHGMAGKSLFENINELLIGLRAEPEYQQYF